MSTHVFATAPFLNCIVRTDMDRGDMQVLAPGLRYPTGIAFAPDNTMYVVESRAGQLSIVDDKGAVRKHVDGLSGPGGIVFDNAGNLYIADAGSDSIKVIDAGGTMRTLATGTARASRIGFDGSKYLYVAGGGNFLVNRFDLQGNGGLFHTLTAAATGLACDADGNVYVSGERTKFDRQPNYPYVAKFNRAGEGQVFINGQTGGVVTVLGSTGNGFLIYTFLGTVIALWKTSDWSFVRSSAWAEYAAVRRDFNFPRA
jgi:sugar lactone lactonase YvrE